MASAFCYKDAKERPYGNPHHRPFASSLRGLAQAPSHVASDRLDAALTLGSVCSRFGRHRLRKRYSIVFSALTQRGGIVSGNLTVKMSRTDKKCYYPSGYISKNGRAQEPPRWGGGPRSVLARGRWWGFPFHRSFTNTDNRYLFPLILQPDGQGFCSSYLEFDEKFVQFAYYKILINMVY